MKEAMRVAFLQKVAQCKLGLQFSQVQTDDSFADIVSVLDGWDELTGAEKRERTVSLFGENNRSKGYKLAGKYRLLDLNGVVHVLTRSGKKGGVPVELGGDGGEETSDAGDARRLVPESDLFDVLWDTHVDAGGHCKNRTFDDRVRQRFVGIPRCVHAAPSHPTSPVYHAASSHPVPAHLTAPSHPTHFPLPPHHHPLPLPLPVPPTPTPYRSRWVLNAFVGCCVQCMRRVSAKPKSLAGSNPIVVRGFNTRGQVTGYSLHTTHLP